MAKKSGDTNEYVERTPDSYSLGEKLGGFSFVSGFGVIGTLALKAGIVSSGIGVLFTGGGVLAGAAIVGAVGLAAGFAIETGIDMVKARNEPGNSPGKVFKNAMKKVADTLFNFKGMSGKEAGVLIGTTMGAVAGAVMTGLAVIGGLTVLPQILLGLGTAVVGGAIFGGGAGWTVGQLVDAGKSAINFFRGDKQSNKPSSGDEGPSPAGMDNEPSHGLKKTADLGAAFSHVKDRPAAATQLQTRPTGPKNDDMTPGRL